MLLQVKHSLTSKQSFIPDPLTTTSNEETFFQDFLENLEEMFPRYYNYMHSDVA